MKKYLLRAFYHLLLCIGVPFAFLRLLWKSRKNPDYRKRWGERLAINLPKQPATIWIHTVSVGEFLATLPLIERLLDDDYTLLITTTTPTGSAMLKRRLGERVSHCYLPFDAVFLVNTFLNTIQPRVAVFMETEIWANYLHRLQQRGIPTLLINARLSEKSFRGYAKLGDFSRDTLACFTEIACQNAASQRRFRHLGGNATLLGNLKFDLAPPADLTDKQQQLSTWFGDKPFILAASTHKGEDAIILHAFQHSRFADTHRLIIAPRHPERSEEILTLCQSKNLAAIPYSQIKAPLSPHVQAVIIDALGELLYFYSLADFAIIGGSFVPHGGHNPLEAALFATPCIIGEHYFNFDSLIKTMQNKNAIIVTDSDKLLTHVGSLDHVGQNAQRFLADNQGALNRYTTLITTMADNVEKSL